MEKYKIKEPEPLKKTEEPIFKEDDVATEGIAKLIGTRVGACSHIDKDKAYLFGYGVLTGFDIPHEKVAGSGAQLRKSGVKNPKILLDNGKDIFGCECWWQTEENVKKSVEGKKMIILDIDKEREESKKEDLRMAAKYNLPIQHRPTGKTIRIKKSLDQEEVEWEATISSGGEDHGQIIKVNMDDVDFAIF